MADLQALARRKAQKYGLDPNVFTRQIRQESGFNPNAVSPAGAIGIAQIMPATARGWGVNPHDPNAALDAAAKNMARYVKQYGSYRNALVAYNAGPGRVGKSLPAETQSYIKTILGGREPSTSGVSAGGSGGGTTSTRIPGQTITSQIPTIDKAGFEQARKLAIVGGLIARHNPNSFLLRSGLLSTQEPTLSSFMGSKTVKDVIPGATVRTPATASSASIASGSARTPVGRKAKVIGVPHQGTHTLGNWQSDNAVDLAVPEGSPMVSLQDGVVVKVRHHPQDGGRFAGDQITIRGANGNEYFYAHGVASVRPGQRIRKGQRLGRTGSANGVAHLHFGQMRGDPRKHT